MHNWKNKTIQCGACPCINVICCQKCWAAIVDVEK